MKSKSFTQTLCTLYLAVLFIVYPLFQHDHYYNMGDNKYYFYLISTVIFLILLAISVLTDPARYYKSKKKNKNSKGKNKATTVVNEKLTFKQKVIQLKDKFMTWFGPKSIVEKFVWAYLLCAIISFIFGIDHYYGFWGAAGWNMGLLVQCLMIACFFVYAKVWEPNMTPFYFSMIGSSIVMFLGIIMRFGIDPLGNYEGLEQQYINTFISTIGQTSWYSAYISTVIPIGVILFYVSEKKSLRVISGIYTFLSFMALAIADSDSIYLAVAGLLLVLFWVAFTDEKYLIKFFEITTMLAGAFTMIILIKNIFNDYYNAEADITSIKSVEVRMYVGALGISILILLILFLMNKKDVLRVLFEYKKAVNSIRYSVFVMVAIGIASIIVYIILNTRGVFGVTPDMVDWPGSIWYFNDIWGHFRGISWKTCWEVFKDYGLGRKLVGIGPDSLEAITQSVSKYRDMLSSRFGEDQVLSCAHNEFFNHIVVYGVLGGITYLCIYISGIIRYIKEFATKPIVLAGAVCTAMYVGHNFFCYQTVICTPYVFIVIGICEAYTKRIDK